jgi:hypothetical protein
VSLLIATARSSGILYADENRAAAAAHRARPGALYLYTEDGRKLLDGISSWWVNIHGHAHPRLNQAIADQAKTLEHVIFAGATHEPAVDLAERLVGVLPPAHARLLLGQRIDSRRGRGEDRRAVGGTRASRHDSGSSRSTTRITATPSARCR